mgnify:CR=1 FL=1
MFSLARLQCFVAVFCCMHFAVCRAENFSQEINDVGIVVDDERCQRLVGKHVWPFRECSEIPQSTTSPTIKLPEFQA